VKLNPNQIFVCNCQESVFEGLPCKHELCIYIKENGTFHQLNIQQRWKLEYFNPSELSDISISDDERENDDSTESLDDEEKNKSVISNYDFEEQKDDESFIEEEKNEVNFQLNSFKLKIKNPSQKRGRGRPSSTRSKSKMEKKMSKARRSVISKEESQSGEKTSIRRKMVTQKPIFQYI